MKILSRIVTLTTSMAAVLGHTRADIFRGPGLLECAAGDCYFSVDGKSQQSRIFDRMFRSDLCQCVNAYIHYILHTHASLFFTQLTSDVAIHATPALLITCTMWPLMMLQ